MQVFLAIVALVFLAVFVLVLWILRRAVRPLSEMAEAATAVAAGDFTQTIDTTGRDEGAYPLR